jgi:hypothetical protein
VTAALVAPFEISPVSQAPESDVDVWVIPELFVQVTVSPTLIRIGLGVKQPLAPVQLMIWADELAAIAGSADTKSAPITPATTRRALFTTTLPSSL